MKGKSKNIALFTLLTSVALIVPACAPKVSPRAVSTPPVLPTVLLTPEPTRPPWCVPLPTESLTVVTPTVTPMRGQATYPNQWDFNTATPLPISKIIDNHPEQSRDDKWEIDVFTCDGLYIKYWLYMPADATLEVLKNPGDIVIASGPPAAMMGRAPYARLTEAAWTQTVTAGMTLTPEP